MKRKEEEEKRKKKKKIFLKKYIHLLTFCSQDQRAEAALKEQQRKADALDMEKKKQAEVLSPKHLVVLHDTNFLPPFF